MTEDRLIGWRNDMKTGGGRSRATVVMDSAMHTYVMVCLSQRRLSQTAAGLRPGYADAACSFLTR